MNKYWKTEKTQWKKIKKWNENQPLLADCTMQLQTNWRQSSTEELPDLWTFEYLILSLSQKYELYV